MDIKRLRGITIFSWLIIIGSVLNFLSNSSAAEVNPLFSVYFYYIISVLSIIIAFFLFKLKDWSRVSIIIVSILVGLETIVTTPHVLNQIEMHERIGLLIGLLIGMVLSLGFNLGIIFW